MLRLLVLILSASVIKCSEVPECNGDFHCVLIRFFDMVDNSGVLKIFENFVRKSGEKEEERKSDGLIERFVEFITSDEIKGRGITDRNLANEPRTKKIKKILLPILMFLKLKAAIVIPAILAGMAILAVKGFGMSLVALTIASAVALKNFVAEEHHGPKLAYEIVPQVWNRNSGMEVLPLGYQPIS